MSHGEHSNHSCRSFANHSCELFCNYGYMETLAERIRRLREQCELSQGQLARLIDCSRPAVSKWESGETHNLKLDNLVRLCAVYQISVADFLSGIVGVDNKSTKRHEAKEPTPNPYNVAEFDPRATAFSQRFGRLSPAGKEFMEQHVENGFSLAEKFGDLSETGTAAEA
jgi:transcriptional regulator with XRE-family HTH domain